MPIIVESAFKLNSSSFKQSSAKGYSCLLQNCFEQAVSCSYETVLLGVQSGHAHLIAESTINVGREGQTYVEMLAEVVARLVRDGHGRPAARVCFASSSLPAVHVY